MQGNEAIRVFVRDRRRANVGGSPRRLCTFALEGAFHHSLDAAQDGAADSLWKKKNAWQRKKEEIISTRFFLSTGKGAGLNPDFIVPLRQ